jgi:hypothetical protein
VLCFEQFPRCLPHLRPTTYTQCFNVPHNLRTSEDAGFACDFAVDRESVPRPCFWINRESFPPVIELYECINWHASVPEVVLWSFET